MKTLTNKQRRGEAQVPSVMIITQIDMLHEGRRSDGFTIPPIAHGKKGYVRHSKHRGKESE